MPTPNIVVFVSTPSTKEEAQLIKAISDYGLIPKADAIHHKSYLWFHDNLTDIPHMLYQITPSKAFPFTADDLNEEMSFSPDLLISFNEDEEGVDFQAITAFVNYYFTETGHLQMIDGVLVHKAREFITIPETQVSTLSSSSSSSSSTSESTEYEFRLKEIPELDIAIYEVVKPFTYPPYTAVTRNYSEIKHTNFFTDLFICESWGVCSADITFLEKVWRHLNQQGPFNIEEMYKQRVESCYPSSTRLPNTEPEVYRRELEQVEETIRDQARGIKCQHTSKRHRGDLPENLK